MDLMDYRRKIIANSPHLSSATGAVASFSDGADDIPLKSLVVNIDPVQDLHGYDSPWVAGGGVNKIDYLSCIGIGGRDGTDSIFGNNTSISGNQLTINRSYAQGGGLLKGVGVFPMSTGDKVTISGSVTLTNTSRMYVGVGNYDGGGTNGILAVTPSNGKFVVTVTAGSDYAKTGIFLQPESASSSMVVSNVMVALGETEKPYEPYENICPITGWNGVKVTRCGKNLFSTFEEGDITSSGITFDFSDSDVVKISGKSTATNASSQNKIIGGTNTPTPIEFRQGNTYTISLQGTVSISKANDFRLYLRLNNNSNLWYGDSTNGVWTITPESTFVAERIMFRIKSNGTTVNVDAHLQIELGSTATPYEPYNGVNVSIDLGQTVYGGTLNPLTGVLTVDRLGVPMESLTWYRSTSYANPIFYTTITGKASDYRKSACSILRNIGSSTIIAAKGFATQSANGDFASSDANAQIYARYDSATTVQAFVTAVTGQTIVYPLANPVTIQLTPHQIRSLYGSNTIFADTGNISLEYWAHP